MLCISSVLPLSTRLDAQRCAEEVGGVGRIHGAVFDGSNLIRHRSAADASLEIGTLSLPHPATAGGGSVGGQTLSMSHSHSQPARAATVADSQQPPPMTHSTRPLSVRPAAAAAAAAPPAQKQSTAGPAAATVLSSDSEDDQRARSQREMPNWMLNDAAVAKYVAFCAPMCPDSHYVNLRYQGR